MLLDHGLYRQLPEDFRRAYCRLWAAILDGDVEGVKRFCAALGVPSDAASHALLSAVLVMRPWDDVESGEIIMK